jgi:hypothetical protein
VVDHGQKSNNQVGEAGTVDTLRYLTLMGVMKVWCTEWMAGSGS